MHIEEAYRNLANAIVIQAANDYRNALEGKSYYGRQPKSVIIDVERFFHSSWYRELTKIDGDFLLEQLDREYKEKVRKEQLCKSN